MFELRRMELLDVQPVSVLYRDANPQETLEQIVERTRGYLPTDGDTMLVLADATALVGGVTGIRETEKLGLIEDIAVAKPYRQKGFAKKLLDGVEEAFLRKGVEEVIGDIHYKNAQIVNLAIPAGYLVEEVILDYFAPGEHAIRVHKKLK